MARSFGIHKNSTMEIQSSGPIFRVTKASWSILTILLGFSPWVSGEILRLSKVVAEGSDNAERIELNDGTEREVLFVEKRRLSPVPM